MSYYTEIFTDDLLMLMFTVFVFLMTPVFFLYSLSLISRRREKGHVRSTRLPVGVRNERWDVIHRFLTAFRIPSFIVDKIFPVFHPYTIDGEYGGGKGLKRIYRDIRLRKLDREGYHRGLPEVYRDAELERLISDGRLDDAARYLRGICFAAKDVRDEFTIRRYEKYREDLLEAYRSRERDEWLGMPHENGY